MTEEATEKNTRDAFLYLEPKKKKLRKEFAQCSTCRMFVPDEYTEGKIDLCIIHGSDVKVGEGYSCGMYAPWPKGTPEEKVMQNHAKELSGGLPGSFTPEESGLVEREVRCENCEFHRPDEGECGLYALLNKKMPDYFDLDVKVEPHGCCNANIQRDNDGDEGAYDLRSAIDKAISDAN